MIGVAHTSPQIAAEASRTPRAKGRTCPECLGTYMATGPRQIFCSDEHKTDWEERARLRARQIFPFAAADRATRSGTRGTAEQRKAGKKAARIARTLYQRWKEEDAEKGRMSAIDYAALRIRMGYDPL